DLVLLDEVQQQVERSLEVRQPNRVGVEDGLEFLFHHEYLNFTAWRTRSIVCSATTRAFREPSCRISRTAFGVARTAARRSRMGSRCALIAFASLVLTSTSPTLPVR